MSQKLSELHHHGSIKYFKFTVVRSIQYKVHLCANPECFHSTFGQFTSQLPSWRSYWHFDRPYNRPRSLANTRCNPVIFFFFFFFIFFYLYFLFLCFAPSLLYTILLWRLLKKKFSRDNRRVGSWCAKPTVTTTNIFHRIYDSIWRQFRQILLSLQARWIKWAYNAILFLHTNKIIYPTEINFYWNNNNHNHKHNNINVNRSSTSITIWRYSSCWVFVTLFFDVGV